MSTGSGNPFSDIFGTKEVIGLVARKLSSQALLFSLAVIVILPVTVVVLGPAISIPILFIFLVGTVGYLFFEQRDKVQKEDPQTLSRILGVRIKTIQKSPGAFSVRVWAAPDGAGAASRDIGVGPKGKIGRYRVGDKIDVRFQADSDCYLTLLNLGTSGKLTILFPNSLHRDNFIKAGQIHEIPGDEYGFEYRIQGPAGVETLKAIATLERVEILENQIAADGTLFLTQEPTAAARDNEVVKRKVEDIPAAA